MGAHTGSHVLDWTLEPRLWQWNIWRWKRQQAGEHLLASRATGDSAGTIQLVYSPSTRRAI